MNNQCNNTAGLLIKPDTHYDVRDGWYGQRAYVAGIATCPYGKPGRLVIWYGWLRHGPNGNPVPHLWTNAGRAMCGNRGHDLIRAIDGAGAAEELNVGDGWCLLSCEQIQKGDQILNPYGWWQNVPAGLVGKTKPKNVLMRRRV